MAFFSMLPWTTDTVGDGAARYNEERANEFFRIFDVIDEEREGVVPGRWDEFAVSGTASPLTIGSGAAVCYGRVWNDEETEVEVPTPVFGTTGGRVVLRADWAAKTIRPAVKMTLDGNTGTPPLEQVAGDTWEISLAAFEITTGGVITLTDDRTFMRSALAARQGGDAADWFVAGTSTQQVNGTLLQAGSITFPVLGGGVPLTNINEPVTFPVEFADKPLVVATLSAGVNGYLYAIPTSGAGFNVAMIFDPAVSTNTSVTVSWLAIGPRK